jgi:hypothetical protein
VLPFSSSKARFAGLAIKEPQNSGQMPTLAQELRTEPETLYEAALGFRWRPDGIEHS